MQARPVPRARLWCVLALLTPVLAGNPSHRGAATPLVGEARVSHAGAVPAMEDWALEGGDLARALDRRLVAGALDWRGSVLRSNHRSLENRVLEPAIEISGRLSGEHALIVTFGADPARTRGTELLVDVRNRQIHWREHPRETGPEPLEASGSSDERERAFRLQLKGRSLSFEVDGRKVRLRGAARTVPRLAEGRIFLGASGPALRWAEPRVLVRMTREAARFVSDPGLTPPRLPRPRPLAMSWPLDRFPWEGWSAEEAPPWLEGLREADRRRRTGDLAGAAERVREIAAQHPKAGTPHAYLGCLELRLGLRPGRAVQAFARARELGGPFTERWAEEGDAELLLGRLDRALEAYGRASGAEARASGEALVAWARGDVVGARERVEALGRLAGRGDRRTGLRLRALDEVLLIHDSRPVEIGLDRARDRRGRVTVWSDRDAAAAGRVAALVAPCLARLRQALDLGGGDAPVRVLALADRAAFDRWNARLGGSRFRDTDGIYRPVTRLVVVRDDADERLLRERLQHELVHLALHDAARSLPPVLEEGLAEWLAAENPRRGARVRFGQDVMWGRWARARELGRSDPIAVLLGDPGLEGGRALDAYAIAWATLHWFGREWRAGGRARVLGLLALGSEPATDDAAWRVALQGIARDMPVTLQAHLAAQQKAR